MSLAVRLAAAFVGLVVVTAFLFGTASVVTAERGVTQQLDRFLSSRAEDIVDGTRDRPNRRGNRDGRERPEVGSAIVAIGNAVEDDANVQLISPEGTVEFSSGLELPVENVDEEIASGSSKPEIRDVEVEGIEFRMITMGFPDGGAVQVARARTEALSTVALIRSQLLVIIPVLAIIAAAGGVLLARRITRPIKRLAETVDDVAETGDLSRSVAIEGDDEVARLAARFDNLLRRLAESRDQQQRLVQNAAHELRTPLTSVKANVDLLSLDAQIPAEEREQILMSLRSELRELNQLVTEVVEVATDRFSTNGFDMVDLADVATDAVTKFEARSDRHVEASIASAVVHGDRDGLVRVVDNLLSNAGKYSPEDTPISLTVTPDLTLTVSDRGSGIDPSERDRVFDRFYRSDTARAKPGSGLGLSIAKAIIDAHRGTITITDRPGGGTTVSFQLPPQT